MIIIVVVNKFVVGVIKWVVKPVKVFFFIRQIYFFVTYAWGNKRKIRVTIVVILAIYHRRITCIRLLMSCVSVAAYILKIRYADQTRHTMESRHGQGEAIWLTSSNHSNSPSPQGCLYLPLLCSVPS